MVYFAAMKARKAYTDDDLTPFGRRLVESYRAAGYTQSSFGRAAGISTASMNRLQYDKSLRGVAFDTMDRIETLTGVRFQYLALGKQPIHGPPETPMEKAADLARSKGVPDDVIAQMIRRYEGATWDVQGWYRTMLTANDRAARDEAWRKELRRVKMAAADAAEKKKIEALKSGEFSPEDAARELAS